MASMEIITELCDCGARATRRIRDDNGDVVGLTCTKCATARLIAQNEIEAEADKAAK